VIDDKSNPCPLTPATAVFIGFPRFSSPLPPPRSNSAHIWRTRPWLHQNLAQSSRADQETSDEHYLISTRLSPGSGAPPAASPPSPPQWVKSPERGNKTPEFFRPLRVASQAAPAEPSLNPIRPQAASFPFTLPQPGISKMSGSHLKYFCRSAPSCRPGYLCGHQISPQHRQKLQLAPPTVRFPCRIPRLTGPDFPRLSSGSIFTKTAELGVPFSGSIYFKPSKKLSRLGSLQY
jgi:hypothetical protein